MSSIVAFNVQAAKAAEFRAKTSPRVRQRQAEAIAKARELRVAEARGLMEWIAGELNRRRRTAGELLSMMDEDRSDNVTLMEFQRGPPDRRRNVVGTRSDSQLQCNATAHLLALFVPELCLASRPRSLSLACSGGKSFLLWHRGARVVHSRSH